MLTASAIYRMSTRRFTSIVFFLIFSKLSSLTEGYQRHAWSKLSITSRPSLNALCHSNITSVHHKVDSSKQFWCVMWVKFYLEIIIPVFTFLNLILHIKKKKYNISIAYLILWTHFKIVTEMSRNFYFYYSWINNYT